jgi:NitT/TauT family transport system ATP-binding protein
LLDLVGLENFANRYPAELSGGMKQRVAIARCLVQEPRVLLMDEPFAALDEQTRTRMGSELLQIWDMTGRTVLFVTHGLAEAIYLADVVFVMAARPGRIIERFSVDLPRPRTIDMIGSEEFGRLRNRIWHLIGEVRA